MEEAITKSLYVCESGVVKQLLLMLVFEPQKITALHLSQAESEGNWRPAEHFS